MQEASENVFSDASFLWIVEINSF